MAGSGSSWEERRLEARTAADGAARVVGSLDGGVALTADRMRATHAPLSPTARWGTRESGAGVGKRSEKAEKHTAHESSIAGRRLGSVSTGGAAGALGQAFGMTPSAPPHP